MPQSVDSQKECLDTLKSLMNRVDFLVERVRLLESIVDKQHESIINVNTRVAMLSHSTGGI